MKITPNIFLTSDTHFGHTKLWELWGREEDFEDKTVENWNSVVGKRDIVLHLGDLTFTSKEKTKEWTDRLKGIKYLIRGNHDGATDGWYRDVGFEVIPAAFWKHKDKYDKWSNYLFTHIPEIPIPEDWFNIHGHLHGSSTHRDENSVFSSSGQHIDVGVDCYQGPIKLQDIMKILKLL